MVEINYLIQQYPRASIVIIALVVSFFISLINYFFLNKEKMREIKKRQKELQVQMKEHQKSGNHEKLMDLQKEMLSGSMEMMKHSMVPMLITFVPIILFFGFVRSAYADTTLASSWFWWYLVTAIAGSIIFRKLLKLP